MAAQATDRMEKRMDVLRVVSGDCCRCCALQPADVAAFYS